jgi:hypothetical protein
MATKKSVAGSSLDPTIKFSKITIDEREYSLAFSFNAIAEAERIAGCNLLAGAVSVWNNLGDADKQGALMLRGLLYAALSVAQPDISLQDAGKLIRVENITDIVSALHQAFALSLPESKEDDEPKKSETEQPPAE